MLARCLLIDRAKVASWGNKIDRGEAASRCCKPEEFLLTRGPTYYLGKACLIHGLHNKSFNKDDRRIYSSGSVTKMRTSCETHRIRTFNNLFTIDTFRPICSSALLTVSLSLSTSDYIASNDWWTMNWKIYRRHRSWQSSQGYTCICMDGLRKTTKNLSKNAGLQGVIWTIYLQNTTQEFQQLGRDAIYFV
jgi:hypothetical protein